MGNANQLAAEKTNEVVAVNDNQVAAGKTNQVFVAKENEVVADKDIIVNLTVEEIEEYYQDFCKKNHKDPETYMTQKKYIAKRLAYNKVILQKYYRMCKPCIGMVKKPISYYLEGFTFCNKCKSPGVRQQVWDQRTTHCFLCGKQAKCYLMTLCYECKGLGLQSTTKV